MHLNLWTLALQSINVLVLIWLLSRFLYRPILAAIAQRQAAAEKLLADAAAARERAAGEEAALKSKKDASDGDAEQIKAEARASAEADRSRLLEEARREAAQLTLEATAALSVERARLTKELEARAAILAGEMAAKLLGQLPRVAVEAAMRDKLCAFIAAMPEAERASLAAGPLTLVTANGLDEADRATYRDALATVLPTLPELTFAEDATLIAGCELRGVHTFVRKTWRSDLTAMLEPAARKDDHVERA